MAMPVILAVDDGPRVLRAVERGSPDRTRRPGPEAASRGRRIAARYPRQVQPSLRAPFPSPQPLASGRRRTGAASDRSVEVADNDPAETSRVVRVQIRESKIEKGRFA